MSDTNTQQQGNRRRNRRPGGNNKSGGYSGGRSATPRGGVPQQTGFQKFLSAVTFGFLGKPATLPQAQRSAPPAADTSRGPRPPRDRDAAGRPPREPRGPRRENGPVDPSSIDTDRLYIGNLSYDASESDLFELFNGVGGVRNAEVVVNNRTQRSKGFAFVTMSSVEEARRAVAELSGKEFMGRPLQLSGAKPIGSNDRDSQDDES
jgi:RNA recognition motif. (a.k.a. RRM, RBD, or RNP domain)